MVCTNSSTFHISDVMQVITPTEKQRKTRGIMVKWLIQSYNGLINYRCIINTIHSRQFQIHYQLKRKHGKQNESLHRKAATVKCCKSKDDLIFMSCSNTSIHGIYLYHPGKSYINYRNVSLNQLNYFLLQFLLYFMGLVQDSVLLTVLKSPCKMKVSAAANLLLCCVIYQSRSKLHNKLDSLYLESPGCGNSSQ